MVQSQRLPLGRISHFLPSREDIWCLILTFIFAAPPLFFFVRHPRPIFLVFTVILGVTGFRPIQLIQRAGEARYIHAYLGVLYLLLSPGMMTVAGPAEGIRHYIFYYCLTLVLISILSLSGRYAWLVKIPVAIAVAFSLVVCFVFLAYAVTNGSLLSEEALNAVYQTDLHEAVGYIETFIGFRTVAISLALLFLPAFLLFRLRRPSVQGLARAEYGALLAVTMLLAYETRDTSNEYLVVPTALKYRSLIQRHRLAAAQRRTRLTDIEAKYTRKEPETHVVVVGESTNRNHMGLYGYFRDTTPNLGRLAKNLVTLTDAISSDRFTEFALELALSVADVDNQLSRGDPSAYSLLDVLRAAGIRVYWLSNQTRLSLFDNHTTLLAEGADRLVFVSRVIGEKTSSGPDEALFPAVKTALDEARDAKVIFVHLMGTHVPYSLRYPKEFSRYRGSVLSGELGGSKVDEKVTLRIDEYDNAVLYDDYVVSKLIEELRGRGGSCSLLYFSDHGETPLGTTREQTFSPGQVEIPMFFWFSDKFRDNHSALIEVLTANRRKRFMNDHLFEVALDLVGVETRLYSPQRSLFRREFVERNRRTLRGKLDYDGYPDPIIVARNNMALLAARFPRLAQKVYVWSGPNRSSLGRAIELFPGVALDLVFNEQRGTFDVAQSVPGVGMTLGHALEFLRSSRWDAKLLLRLGNLRESNAAQAAAALVKLDEEYRFRERVTLVAPYASGRLRSLVQLGFTTAFTAVEGRSLVLPQADDAANGRHVAIMAVSSGAGLRVRENPESLADELRSPDSIVVESDVDPSDGAFVDSLSKLSEADTRRTIAIVVRALSKFDQHF